MLGWAIKSDLFVTLTKQTVFRREKVLKRVLFEKFCLRLFSRKTSLLNIYQNFKELLQTTLKYFFNFFRCEFCWECNLAYSLHKKWSFPLRISSVNVTKSVVFGGFGEHIPKKSLMENFIFSSVEFHAKIKNTFRTKNALFEHF